KQDAINKLLEVNSISQKEAEAELLLEAKGFTDVVVSITDGSVDVVVNAASLSDADRAQIEDIVKRKTEISADKIIIMPFVENN
ncbi:MAG: SpoIIIAH-like family protein, partial [Lachnospiraceae bacterium]|nr:SpoIIIAH-like family protein [Lachnospiraceae bacterium]